jgi:hypothetical protein
MIEKDLKNSDRSSSERKLESNMIEEIYSFKTMLRMLYQAGVIILRQTESAVVIPHVSFPCSWIEFTRSSGQNQKEESEEASLIEVAECFISSEEFIKPRKMLVTSRIRPTSTASPYAGEGT